MKESLALLARNRAESVRHAAEASTGHAVVKDGVI